VRFGQWATLVLVIISLGWIPFMKTLMGGGIFHYLQSIQAYISPPIAAVFLFGLIYKWINARGAIVALWTGFILGIFRLVTEYMSKEGILIVNQDSFLGMMLDINFLHFALILFAFSTVVLMVVSKTGYPQSAEILQLVTFQRKPVGTRILWSSDMSLTVILIVLVLALWWLFSSWGIA
jgi:SSS family solute:Na+ symporter